MGIDRDGQIIGYSLLPIHCSSFAKLFTAISPIPAILEKNI